MEDQYIVARKFKIHLAEKIADIHKQIRYLMDNKPERLKEELSRPTRGTLTGIREIESFAQHMTRLEMELRLLWRIQSGFDEIDGSNYDDPYEIGNQHEYSYDELLKALKSDRAITAKEWRLHDGETSKIFAAQDGAGNE